MIAKKTAKADLEKKRFAFFQIGLLLAGALCLAAFEYSSPIFSDTSATISEQSIDWNVQAKKQDLRFTNTKSNKQVSNRTDEVKIVKTLPAQNHVQTVTEVIDIDFSDLGDIPEPGTESDFRYPEGLGSVIIPDIMPEFPGGSVQMARWISKHLNIPKHAYPVSGTIYVRFIVAKNGDIKDVSILKGIDPTHDQAALIAVEQMPRWIPGERDGKPVPVQFDLPIKVINR